MLPLAYGSMAAYILTAGGLLACFAGHRLFRVVLGIFGFVLGAMTTTSIVGTESTTALVAAALAGGVFGALLMFVAYFMGVGLVGAGLAALVLNFAWRAIGGEPPTWLLVVVCVVAALAALSVARHVIVFGTAIAGGWTIIVGILAIAGNPAAQRAASAGNVWIFYPLGPTPGEWWQVAAWFALSVAGAVVQMGTAKTRSARGTSKPKTK